MADEQAVVEAWLDSVLNDPDDDVLPVEVPGGFWADTVPQIGPSGATLTDIAGFYRPISQTHRMVANTIRIWNDALWLIAVSAPAGSADNLSTAVSHIDDLLHGQAGVEVDSVGRIESCVNEQIWSQHVVQPGGTEYRERGGIFRIKAKVTA